MTKKEIMLAVKRHHNAVFEHYPNSSIIMTVLDGSQNYGLDHDKSDIDTFTFVLPSIYDISRLKDPVTHEFSVKDGKCSVKDIRLALNLLRKTNPNSVEWFTSHYVILEPKYSETIKKYLLWSKFMIYADINHMLNACAGMSYQLSKRNMPAGKAYSHCLRIENMLATYLKHDGVDILSFRTEESRQQALQAKLSSKDYGKLIEESTERIKALIENYAQTEYDIFLQKKAREIIYSFEYELTTQHLLMCIDKQTRKEQYESAKKEAENEKL